MTQHDRDQIMDFIWDVNQLILENVGDKVELPIVWALNDLGSVQSITFGDVIIWDSESDDRVVIDEATETYEPWKAYLTAKFEVYVDYLQSIVNLLK